MFLGYQSSGQGTARDWGGGGLSWAEKGVFLLAPTAFLSGYLRSSTSKTCWQSSRGLSLLPPTHSFQKTDGLGVTGNGV